MLTHSFAILVFLEISSFVKDGKTFKIFVKSSKEGSTQYELKRFSILTGYTIMGGASKLLKHFEREYKPNSLISYQNLRWSIRYDFYLKLGFEYLNYSEPSIFIIKNNKVYNRLNFQKHKLKDIPEFIFDKNSTGEENLLKNGYRLLWDVGNLVFLKNYKKEES